MEGVQHPEKILGEASDLVELVKVQVNTDESFISPSISRIKEAQSLTYRV